LLNNKAQNQKVVQDFQKKEVKTQNQGFSKQEKEQVSQIQSVPKNIQPTEKFTTYTKEKDLKDNEQNSKEKKV